MRLRTGVSNSSTRFIPGCLENCDCLCFGLATGPLLHPIRGTLVTSATLNLGFLYYLMLSLPDLSANSQLLLFHSISFAFVVSSLPQLVPSATWDICRLSWPLPPCGILVPLFSPIIPRDYPYQVVPNLLNVISSKDWTIYRPSNSFSEGKLMLRPRETY